MRRDAALADRSREVRQAARGWRSAAAIDDTVLAAIEAAYSDDRARLGPVFRIVAFVAGFVALNAAFGVLAIASRGASGLGLGCLVYALLLAGATELLLGPLKRADSGIETATALLAVTYGVLGFSLVFERPLGSERLFVAALLAFAVTLSALGASRWGSPLLALVASVCTLLFLARLPAGRLLWLALGTTTAPLFLRAGEDARFPPSHRRSFQVGTVVALCAVYVAVHLGSWDERWLEWLADFHGERGAALEGMRPLSILATAVVPLLVLAFGAATRRAYLLDLGIVLAVASLITLRFYVHVAPLWAVLVVSGLAALAAALVLRRVLARGKGGERVGFTAEPLFEDPRRRHTAEIVGAIATLSPAPAARAPARGDGTLEPGGGRYGGGGATSDF